MLNKMKNAPIAIFLVLTACLSVLLEGSSSHAQQEPNKNTERKKALVIAHRGASGYRPEHTLEAYKLAIEMGADYIEPDLVCTKDGALVARHDNELSQTTDVASHPEFSDRRMTKSVDGKEITGWFSESFTLAEIKTLRAIERMPDVRQHNTIYNNLYSIPTFQEVIDLAKKKSAELNKQIGIYPEAKHPTHFLSLGLSNEKPLIEALHKNGYVEPSSPVFIQCFEPSSLKRMKAMTQLKLVQLIDSEGQPFDSLQTKGKVRFADMVTPEGLREVATYAAGIGPHKELIFPRDNRGTTQKPTDLVPNAHRCGLVVHPWTFRNENKFLPAELRQESGSHRDKDGLYGNALAEYRMFMDAGVDGVFSENPDTACQAELGMQMPVK